MKAERWQQLDQLFHSALEREPVKRAAFLDEACAGDESLRKQVDRLLAAHEEAGSFIERPAFEVEAQSLANDQIQLAAGQTIGHYRIVSPLGEGGMGEVYLAEDTTLGRKIALKLLPADFTRNIDRARRFQQEARAASALNHPNIITIHEIAQIDHRDFIATEFIEGETLRQRIAAIQSRSEHGQRKRGLPLVEVLNIAIQTADALGAAHEAGIVHRDIKPENIMVRRRDGYIKVLDFGLAKLTENVGLAVDTEATTRAQVKTSAGLVMGTPGYMSPEQARGEAVDARTDIWSLGVVLYEMLAGCAPFERPTSSEVIALILEREPPPLPQYVRGLASDLERIISKALTKDREQRYQTAKDLQIELRRLQHRFELETESEHFASPPVSRGTALRGYAHVEMIPTDSFAARSEMVRPTSSAEYLINQIKQSKWGVISATAMLLIATIGGGFVLYRLLGQRLFGQPPQPFATSPSMTINRLTNSGRATAAAISADGNYVVYGLEDGSKQSLWLRQVKSTSEKEIVAPQEMHFVGLAFSPDGNLIYYTSTPRNVLANITFRGVLYQVPTLGGTPRKVVENVNGPVAVSPDGRRIAFIRTSEGEPHVDVLMVASVDGTGERQLTMKRDKAYLDPNPAWSPDGKTIICGAGVEPDYFYESILQVSAEDGKERWLTAHKWFQVSRLAWLTDRSGLIAVAHEKLGRGSQIWHISYPAGDVQRITHDLNGYGNNQELSASLSLTADSKNLVVVQHDSTSKIWVTATGEDESRARAISTGKLDGDAGVWWASNGEIICGVVTGDDPDIWLMKPDGTERSQLTTDSFYEAWPRMSPDGRYIVFASLRDGYFNLWRTEADGNNQKQLTYGTWTTIEPSFSPDGQSLAFTSNRWTGSLMVGKIAIDGGEPVQLTTYPSFWPAFSPDGKLIAVGLADQKENSVRLAIIPATGGQPSKLFDFPSATMTEAGLVWTVDGQALTYVNTKNGVSNIWSQRVDGGLPKQLTHFKSDMIFDFALSPDGRQFVLARGTKTHDVVLIRDFR